MEISFKFAAEEKKSHDHSHNEICNMITEVHCFRSLDFGPRGPDSVSPSSPRQTSHILLKKPFVAMQGWQQRLCSLPTDRPTERQTDKQTDPPRVLPSFPLSVTASTIMWLKTGTLFCAMADFRLFSGKSDYTLQCQSDEK